VVVGAGGHHLARGGDDLRRQEVVTGQPVGPARPAVAAAQRQPRDPGCGDDPTGGHQPEQLGLVVDVTPGRPSLDPDGPGTGVDVDAPHPREVDDDTAVTDARPGDAVAATADRQREAAVARELDGPDHATLTTPAVPAGRATTAGYRSTRPFQTRQASSYPSSSGVNSAPRNPAANAATALSSIGRSASRAAARLPCTMVSVVTTRQ